MNKKGKAAMDWILLNTGLDRVSEKFNLICGVVTTFLSAMLGENWELFAGFLILNIVDYITGWIKAKFYKKNENSTVGAKGILKKAGYWVVIGVAFYITCGLKKVGEIIGVNLEFTLMFGYLTLATYIINEIRSVLENIAEMNVNVPAFLVKGLQVANEKVNAVADIETEEAEEKEDEDK